MFSTFLIDSAIAGRSILTGQDHLLENGGRFAGILGNFGQLFFGHLVEGDIGSGQNGVGALGAEDVGQASTLRDDERAREEAVFDYETNRHSDSIWY